MEIKFNITTEEADIIALQYAFDGLTDRDEFVLEKFKEFGRTCIVSQANRVASESEELAKKNAVESAKTAISF